MNRQFVNPSKEKRAFVVLDLENQCGGADLVPSYAGTVRNQLASIGLQVPSQVVLAVGPRARTLCPNLPFLFPGARLLCRSGKDGADICLCEVLTEESAASRSQVVVIGSGDRLFTAPARQLRENGCRIIVAAKRGSIHHSLYEVAHQVIHLDEVAYSSTQTHLMGPA
jgi:hypothetical protein